MKHRKRLISVLLILLGSHGFQVLAQDCRAPVQTVSGEIIFSTQQETYLGDVVAQSHATTAKIIEDEELVAPLHRMGERLSAYVPAGFPKFQFFLIELPYPNAYVLPGARVFVSRKLILMARTPDELAGVMAHEMGHELTRQIARDYSDLWRAVLKVNSVGDRQDIDQKYDQFWDTLASNRGEYRAVIKRMEREQIEADTAGLLIMARAGYNPKAYADFFDRLAETRGKTGNWFTDIFGGTSPDSKRLREIQKNLAPPPLGCGSSQGSISQAEFADWQTKVMKFSGPGKKESVPPGTQKQLMKDPLRAEISNLRFSPNGQYVLAQDVGSIFVLSREPFKYLFRIDAEEARFAEFTPDSKSVVFATNHLRIEKWDISQQQQIEVYEPTILRGCRQTLLSPTGEHLACLQLGEDGKYPMQLALRDARTGDSIWIKTGVLDPARLDFRGFFALWNGAPVNFPIDFSPDGRYLLGYGHSGPFAYDLQLRKPVELGGRLIDHIKQNFVFLTNSTVLGQAGIHGEHSEVLKFPTGESIIGDVNTGDASAESVARGNYVILRPVAHFAAGVMDLATKKIFISSKTRAIDTYDGTYVSERKNGELGLYQEPGKPPVAVATLPVGPLNVFRAAAVSPDLRYLSYSDESRGAVWDISTGARLTYVRGFDGAFFDADSTLLLTFPPPDSYWGRGGTTREEAKQIRTKEWTQEEIKKVGAQTVRVNLATNQFTEISSTTARFSTWQSGPYLLTSAKMDENAKRLNQRELEVRDASTGKLLWTRKFHSTLLPKWNLQPLTNSMEFLWDLNEIDAREMVKADPELHKKVEALKNKMNGELVEVVDARTGTRRFAFPLDTGEGSFQVDRLSAAGNTVLTIDSFRRLFVIDENGSRKGRIFANMGILDRTGKFLAAETSTGRIGVFDTSTMVKLYEMSFPSRIALLMFSDNSKQMIVITADQTVYKLKLAS